MGPGPTYWTTQNIFVFAEVSLGRAVLGTLPPRSRCFSKKPEICLFFLKYTSQVLTIGKKIKMLNTQGVGWMDVD